MSQHYFTCRISKSDSVTVLAGWDRPLQQYFLVITDDMPNSPFEEGIIYSNLQDPNEPSTDWDYFLGVLSEYGAELPDGFSEAIQSDRKMNAGNSVRSWDADLHSKH